jgi:hypothetical protein
VRKKKGKRAGVIAHRVVQNQKRQQEWKGKRRRGLVSTVIPMALRRPSNWLRDGSMSSTCSTTSSVSFSQTKRERKGAEGVVFHRRQRWHGGGGRTEVVALRFRAREAKYVCVEGKGKERELAVEFI